jgi:FAD/FMN-containing dehydrogenase
MTCDNLVGAEVVTADGRVLTASATEHPDLFWGLRGGGGNFGVVTAFDFQLHPVGPVLAGMLVHPIERAPALLRFYREFTRSAPDALTTFAGLMVSPEGAPIAALVLCYNGPVEEGERVIRPLREFGPPVADQVAPMSYVQLQSMLDPAFPPGLQVHWRSDFLKGLDDAMLDRMLEGFHAAPSPLSALLLEQFGGAVRRVGRDETAFDHRDSDYNLVIVSRWADPAQREPNVAWARELSAAMRPFTSGGVYVNYLGVGESADRVRAAYGPAKYERLAAVKAAYDPTNFFHLNQNIPPAAG